MANFASPSGMAVPLPNRSHNVMGTTGRHSMPEQHVTLGGSSDPRWNVLTSSLDPCHASQHQFNTNRYDYRLHRAGSVPIRRDITSPSSGTSQLPYPPAFSPVELKNMMDEESLELFESQSHLLDPESRHALERQRQYLQWQGSMDEPGPMQSVLERQDSAGSGCAPLVDDHDAADGCTDDAEGRHRGGMHQHRRMLQHRMAAATSAEGAMGIHTTTTTTTTKDHHHVLARKRSSSGDGGDTAVAAEYLTGDDGSVHGGRSRSIGASIVAVQELQNAKRQIAALSKEREELLIKVQQLESELETQRECSVCKICRQTPRNCVVLPCLHFTTCDSCFKKHCGGSSVSCPCCNAKCTGFQTLLLMQ